jgi:hypothetical protein
VIGVQVFQGGDVHGSGPFVRSVCAG